MNWKGGWWKGGGRIKEYHQFTRVFTFVILNIFISITQKESVELIITKLLLNIFKKIKESSWIINIMMIKI